MSDDAQRFQVALSLIPGIGGVLARALVSYAGSAEAVFRERPAALTRIPGIGEVMAGRIRDPGILARADEELLFARKYGIRIFYYLDADYPRRFGPCQDAPVLFYLKGPVDLDASKIISIVGTRSATDYGRQACDDLLLALAGRGYDLVVVSGLAYGVDIQAHRSALKYGLPTVGVLGHGLDTLYPAAHARVARSMAEKGGLLTDFPSRTKIDPSNFIRRNRLIAGLSDATIVIESGIKGGALITADIASSYDRDVCAYPGRACDPCSRGCNSLIKKNIAALIENAEDLEYVLGWEGPPKKETPVQQQLFGDLDGEELQVAGFLRQEGECHIDSMANALGLPVKKLSSLLLELEFKGMVAALPGNLFRLR